MEHDVLHHDVAYRERPFGNGLPSAKQEWQRPSVTTRQQRGLQRSGRGDRAARLRRPGRPTSPNDGYRTLRSWTTVVALTVTSWP
jgi:hypothetical protein